METASKKPEKWTKNVGVLGLGLCALCCALPVIGIVGGAGILATVAMYAEKIAIVLLIISAASLAIWQYKKKQTPPSCSINCDFKTENDDAKSKA